MIHGIHHTAKSTPDMDRLIAFYCDLFGAQIMTKFGWSRGTAVADRIVGLEDSSARVAMLKLGNAMIEVFEFETPAAKVGDPSRPVCDHGITHMCFDVTDINGEYERLRGEGMFFLSPPQDLGALCSAYGRDPDGNVVELQEVLDQTSAVYLGLDRDTEQ